MNAPTNGGGGGIPTMYNGVLFRSRNEARWARVFDALGLDWQYEPVDLDGYIPDFVVHADMLVEIKPDLNTDALFEVQQKIDRSGWDGEAVILVPWVEHEAHQLLLGSFGERVRGPEGWQLDWYDCRLMRCNDCELPSFFPDCGSWHCRRCGAEGTNAHVGPIGYEFRKAWADAGNRTQWRPE